MRTLLLVISLAALGQAQSAPPGMKCPQRTLVISEFGDNGAAHDKFLNDHLAYMQGLLKSGKVVMAGPMADMKSAATLFASKDWAEVEELLAKEPFHREHVLKVASHNVWTACELAP